MHCQTNNERPRYVNVRLELGVELTGHPYGNQGRPGIKIVGRIRPEIRGPVNNTLALDPYVGCNTRDTLETLARKANRVKGPYSDPENKGNHNLVRPNPYPAVTPGTQQTKPP